MVALVAPGALVAACSDSTPSTGSGTTAPGSGAPAANSPIAALADVPKDSGLVVEGTAKGPVVLVRPTDTTVKAFSAACPHQQQLLVPPVNGTFTCPLHGSTFDGKTGALKGGPAKTGLKEIAVKIEADKVIFA
jgi:nitrite reductase/ring-hydroxylating ferredoxin subunit